MNTTESIPEDLDTEELKKAVSISLFAAVLTGGLVKDVFDAYGKDPANAPLEDFIDFVDAYLQSHPWKPFKKRRILLDNLLEVTPQNLSEKDVQEFFQLMQGTGSPIDEGLKATKTPLARYMAKRGDLDELPPPPPKEGQRYTFNRQKLGGTVDSELYDLFRDECDRRGLTVSRLLDAVLWHYFGKPKLSFQRETSKGGESL